MGCDMDSPKKGGRSYWGRGGGLLAGGGGGGLGG